MFIFLFDDYIRRWLKCIRILHFPVFLQYNFIGHSESNSSRTIDENGIASEWPSKRSGVLDAVSNKCLNYIEFTLFGSLKDFLMRIPAIRQRTLHLKPKWKLMNGLNTWICWYQHSFEASRDRLHLALLSFPLHNGLFLLNNKCLLLGQDHSFLSLCSVSSNHYLSTNNQPNTQHWRVGA